MPSNHLVGQQSPYLLQHLDNPVDWYPWGQEALQKAKDEQKPILLSVGYSTCHWCHVMAHESFENEHIASIINEHFVAIKVDREERPDIDHIYMSATVAMSGQGGWPMTVFLTPEAKPFFAGTYFPPVSKWGSPGFMDLLNNIAHAWREQREQLISSSHEITQVLIEQSQKTTPSQQGLDLSVLDIAYRQISGNFDRTNGGFGGAPKFPMGHQVSFLLRYYKRSQDSKALEMAEATLKAIAKGGICDHLGGGFHRYSTDANWHVPHFEKMLYDQALLVRAYLECYQETGSLEYAQAAKDALEYVLRDMQHPQGGFYCAEDADSLGEDFSHKSEGAFYIWSQKEITILLGPEHAEIFNFVFGVESDGNAKFDPHAEFVGKNILYRRHSNEEAANHFKTEASFVQAIIQEAKIKLIDQRNKRQRPHLDDKVMTDWNGLMLGVFAFASVILNEPRYLKASQKAADFILKNLLLNEKLLHRWREGQSGIQATLDDYAFLINGLLDLYEASMQEKYFEQAISLAKAMLELFEDKKEGGFFLTAKDAQELIFRPKDVYDGAIPSGNSSGVYALIRLYSMDPQGEWINPVEKTFQVFSGTIEKSPSAYTFFLSAFDFYKGPALSIALEGSLSEPGLAQMQAMVYKHFIPNKSLVYRHKNVQPKAYVCRGNVCHEPVQDITKLEEQILL